MAQMQVNVLNQVPNIAAGTSGALATGGRQGDLVVSEMHGKWYNAAKSGNLWISAALIAGVTIPVNTTTGATFGLYNPAGSGINVELVHFTFGTAAANVATIGQLLATISLQTPTSATRAVNGNMNPMNSGASTAVPFTVATFVASTSHIPLVTAFSTSSMTAVQYEFDGKLILPPGWAMQITSSPVQSTISLPSLAWAEWPI
jgi:hypothetical protein